MLLKSIENSKMLLCGYLSKLTVSAVKTNMQNIYLIHLKTTIIKWLHVNGRPGLDPWVGKIPWRRERLPTPVFWSGEFHGLYSPRGRIESDTTEQLSLSLSLLFLAICKASSYNHFAFLHFFFLGMVLITSS